mmetsp:Transcript_12843/g.37697  ORF Transcript_12843/g.37697 Transcript_12843/m.37697 type:complete len:349 (+) Transcript_12843:1096-2142(+)
MVVEHEVGLSVVPKPFPELVPDLKGQVVPLEVAIQLVDAVVHAQLGFVAVGDRLHHRGDAKGVHAGACGHHEDGKSPLRRVGGHDAARARARRDLGEGPEETGDVELAGTRLLHARLGDPRFAVSIYVGKGIRPDHVPQGGEPVGDDGRHKGELRDHARGPRDDEDNARPLDHIAEPDAADEPGQECPGAHVASEAGEVVGESGEDVEGEVVSRILLRDPPRIHLHAPVLQHGARAEVEQDVDHEDGVIEAVPNVPARLPEVREGHEGRTHGRGKGGSEDEQNEAQVPRQALRREGVQHPGLARARHHIHEGHLALAARRGWQLIVLLREPHHIATCHDLCNRLRGNG